jgi:hypothetical protein
MTKAQAIDWVPNRSHHCTKQLQLKMAESLSNIVPRKGSV